MDDECASQRHLLLGYYARDEVLPGVRYGRPDQLLTPAYWVMRCDTADAVEKNFANPGGSLREEIGFCLLGGYGVTLEVAEAFFRELRNQGAFDPSGYASEQFFLSVLTTPATVKGRPHLYRFPRQRARRLHEAMIRLDAMDLDASDPIHFRSQIQSLDGVGPKTASWIVRNWLDTDLVAILDIHVLRAGWAINLFGRGCKLPNDYEALENRFIIFAERLGVRASTLDAVIWSDMRKFGSRLVRDTSLIEA